MADVQCLNALNTYFVAAIICYPTCGVVYGCTEGSKWASLDLMGEKFGYIGET
jgi:hypothetical protein